MPRLSRLRRMRPEKSAIGDGKSTAIAFSPHLIAHSHFMTRKMTVRLIIALGLCALFFLGLGVRRAVLDAQRGRNYGAELPFTRESALMFMHVRTLYETGSLPERDPKVQAPEGVAIRQTYMIFAEYVYAGLARLLPSGLSLAERVRWVAAAWFCLGIPLLAIWVRRLWGSAFAGLFAGAYYAVGLAAVSRSTGQELSDENFALPLLIGHLAMGAWAEGRSGRAAAVGAAISALLLGCALAAWDLVQFYVMIWAAAGALQWLVRRFEGPARTHWLACFFALILAGLASPYLRSHGFLESYAMLLAYGVVAGMAVEAWLNRSGGMTFLKMRAAGWIALAWRPVFLLLPLLMVPWLIGGYGAAYGHFTGLLWAKLRFLNRLPADPSLLAFDQRILWAPALESVNLMLTIELFPVILFFSFFAFTGIFFLSGRRSSPGVFQLLFGFVLSLLAFLLFKRFHVFLAIYVAALFGWLAHWAFELKRAFPRWCMIALLAYALVEESANVLRAPERLGGSYYYRESDQLARWLRENTGRETVLGPFWLSAYLRAYAGCPIVLHPKFESPEIRNRVKTYYETLFHGDERALRDWAGRYGASYCVYFKGDFNSRRQRYYANALNPPSNSAAALMENEPEKLRYLDLLWGNDRYKVFRIITAADEAEAMRLAGEAEKDRVAGRAEAAKDKACLALVSDPGCQAAMRIALGLPVHALEKKQP